MKRRRFFIALIVGFALSAGFGLMLWGKAFRVRAGEPEPPVRTADGNHWRTARHDAAQTGWNPDEATLTPHLSVSRVITPDGDSIGYLLYSIAADDGWLFVHRDSVLEGYRLDPFEKVWSKTDTDIGVDDFADEPSALSDDYFVVQAEKRDPIQTQMLVLDRETGDVVWREVIRDANSPSDCVIPSFRVVGDHLLAYDLADGQQTLNLYNLTSGLVSASQSAPSCVSNPPLLADGTGIYRIYDEGVDSPVVIQALDPADLAVDWEHQLPVDNLGDNPDWLVGNGFLSLRYGSRLITFDAATGDQLWEKDVWQGDDCPQFLQNYLPLAQVADEDLLLVAGICRTDVAALRQSTGNQVWRESSGDFSEIVAIAIANDIVYIGYISEGLSEVDARGLQEGALLQSIQLDSSYFVGHLELAVAEGRLFVTHLAYVGIVKQTPVDVGLAMTIQPTTRCTPHVGDEIQVTVNVTTSASVASVRAVEIALNPNDSGSWQASTDQGVCSLSAPLHCTLDAMDPGQPVSITMAGTPGDAGTFKPVATILDAGQPDPVSRNNVISAEQEILAAPPQGVDLGIASFDVAQTVQDHNNGVRLVQDKDTYALLFPTSTLTVTQVSAILTATRGGEVIGAPIRPVNDCLEIPFDANDPLNKFSPAFQFELPPEWQAADIQLEAAIDPDGDMPDSTRENNRATTSVSYTQLPPLCLDVYRALTVGSCPGGECQVEGLFLQNNRQILEKARSLLPTSRFIVDYNFDQDNLLTELFGPYELGADVINPGGNILNALWWKDTLNPNPPGCNEANARTLHLALVHPDTDSPQIGGKANIGMGQLLIVADPTVGTSVWSSPAGGDTLAHEIGHNYGRKHVNCPTSGDDSPDGPDPDYPYTPCDFTDGTHYGLNTFLWPEENIGPVVLAPGQAVDMMSYQTPEITSDYTWDAIFNEMEGQKSLMSALPSATRNITGDVFLLSGFISPTTGAAELTYGYRMTTGEAPAQKVRALLQEQAALALQASTVSSYTLRLLDQHGTVLVSEPFTPTRMSETSADDPIHFGVAVPWNDDTSAVQVISNSTEIGRREVSTYTPTVELLAPNGGESASDTLTVRWSGSDADGDDLLYTIQYSRDKGQTWRTLDTHTPRTEMEVKTARLAGTDGAGLVRVIATDGIKTGRDVSDGPFSVPMHVPTATLARPADGTRIAADGYVIVQGRGYDVDDGPLADDALTWTVDGSAVGTGRTHTLFDLFPGRHQLTFTVTDSDGEMDSETVTIHVEGPLPSPSDGWEISTIYVPLVVRNESAP